MMCPEFIQPLLGALSVPAETTDSERHMKRTNSNSYVNNEWTKRNQHSQEYKDPREQFFVTRDLDIWRFDPKIDGFPGVMVEHFCVKFGDSSCIGLWDIMQKNRQTDKRMKNRTPPPATHAMVAGNKESSRWSWRM